MSQTYNKKVVLAAANATARTMRVERLEKLAEWDSKNIVTRFFLGFFFSRPVYHGKWRQQIAERISFKATFCTEDAISLTDAEIDAIRDYWGGTTITNAEIDAIRGMEQ